MYYAFLVVMHGKVTRTTRMRRLEKGNLCDLSKCTNVFAAKLRLCLSPVDPSYTASRRNCVLSCALPGRVVCPVRNLCRECYAVST